MSSTKLAARYVFDETFPLENILEKRITRMGLICFPFLFKIYLRIRSSNLTLEDTEVKIVPQKFLILVRWDFLFFLKYSKSRLR